ncbi:hypothetical protein FACS1894160_1480 [Bacteroidia bacterium]|nr:hypothetical protein FACS1894160_1480 [Bacteroidia bacterium]
MITASEIKKKSENIYREYLQSVVSGEIFFPKILRSNKSVSSDFNEMRKELAEVIEYSKDRKGFGYTIIYKQINTRNHGTQSLPEEISFQTEADFLKYLHKEKEVATFRINTQVILSRFHELKDWITKYPQKVIDNQEDWEGILKVCTYFKDNPVPNLYIRELPIQVHTKFVENNKLIIKELLDILIVDFVKPEETNFEKRFNLKFAEPLVRFRILDTNIAQTYFSGIDDLSVPISQFEKLNLPIKNVLIVENKTNLLTIALTLPELEKTIVIFGSGYKVENLKNVDWFKQTRLFYWGDLDAQGFEILSQFRVYFSHVKSILMDKQTFEKFFENDKGTPSKITIKLNLTDEEQKLYELLKANNWRLEQEKILQRYVNEIINNEIK